MASSIGTFSANGNYSGAGTNLGVRRRETDRIERENHSFAKRLFQKNAVVNKKNMDKHYAQHMKYLTQIRKHTTAGANKTQKRSSTRGRLIFQEDRQLHSMNAQGAMQEDSNVIIDAQLEEEAEEAAANSAEAPGDYEQEAQAEAEAEPVVDPETAPVEEVKAPEPELEAEPEAAAEVKPVSEPEAENEGVQQAEPSEPAPKQEEEPPA
jgi:hypothetical protein